MPLKPLLILSYYFPPHGGAGTQRFAKFARYLPEFGYRPIVVTSDAENRHDSAPYADTTLCEEIGAEVKVVRVPAGHGPGLSAAGRVRMALRFRTDQEAWVAAACEVMEGLVREHQPVAVVTSVSPYAAAAAGRWLQRRQGLPWLLDLRDPWALDGWRVHPTPLHRRYDVTKMRDALRHCDLVIANTPASREAYCRFADIEPTKVRVIPNGFDPPDFVEHPGPIRRDRFDLIHVGTLHSVDPPPGGTGRFSRRSRCRWIDERGRSGRFLFDALARIRAARPELYRRFRLVLIGRNHRSNLDYAEAVSVRNALEDTGYLSHREALGRMQSGSAVVVPLHDVSPGDNALIVPGKTYEAVASERMVLGCLPPGDAARLIGVSGAGEVCPPCDAEAIARTLTAAVERHLDAAPLPGARRDRLDMFTRRSLTADLCNAVEAAQRGSLRPTGDGGVPEDPWQRLESHVHARGHEHSTSPVLPGAV